MPEENSTTEIWKDIPGFPPYMVSSLGRIKGMDGRIMKLKHGKRGYRQVILACRLAYHGKPNKTIYVHALVALAFLGVPPPYCNVNHKRGNWNGDAVDNLEYMQEVENHAKGESHPSAKLTNEKVRRIRAIGKSENILSLAREYGVTPAAIRFVLNGRTWKHILEEQR